jgi:hypothetical protein
LFCSKLMFTNGKIVVCKYIIWFYSNLYFCQTHIWTSLLFIYLYQVLHIYIDGSWFALYFHRQRNIKFLFRRHILYNKINLLVVQKARPLRTKFQKCSWRFYFFIRSVRAFGTTQSLLFISFTKPSMTTLPSSSSKVKLCFLFEWYSRAQ